MQRWTCWRGAGERAHSVAAANALAITLLCKRTTLLSQRSAQNRRCAPLVQLLDQLGVTRAEAHRAVLDAAKARLLALVPRLAPDALVALLSACFPYVGLPELREVPLAVLGQLRPVPPTFLKQLATDKDLFADLPPAVQREVGRRPRPRRCAACLQARLGAPAVHTEFRRRRVLRTREYELILGSAGTLRPATNAMVRCCGLYSGHVPVLHLCIRLRVCCIGQQASATRPRARRCGSWTASCCRRTRCRWWSSTAPCPPLSRR